MNKLEERWCCFIGSNVGSSSISRVISSDGREWVRLSIGKEKGGYTSVRGVGPSGVIRVGVGGDGGEERLEAV